MYVTETGGVAGQRAGTPRARWSRWLAALLVPASLWFLPGSAQAQSVRYGVMMDDARAVLEKVWSDDPQQVERAYCITSWHAGVYFVSRLPTIKTDTIFRVFGVQEAAFAHADPNSIDFECPPGVPELHTHTPATCLGDDANTCTAGGANAYSCQPSRQDLEKLIRRGDPFGIIQCDRRSFRFYYPAEYGPPLAEAAMTINSSRPDSRGNVTAAGTGSKP
jgi:hypothetical protein